MDDFYILQKPTVKKVQAILSWANKHALRTDVDMLDCSVSVARQRANKTFEEVLALVNKKAIGFLKVIVRRQTNILDLTDRRDLVEVFIRSIDVGQTEYFIFIYMDLTHLPFLENRYLLTRLGS